MSNIATLIKELRNKTGAGFLDCKNAIAENDNNIDDAIEYLRKKGLAKASKKTSREANEGAIGIFTNDKNSVIILKINSETDFAAKSETFLNFFEELGQLAIQNITDGLNKENFLDLKYKESTVSEYFSNMIAKIGENIILTNLISINKHQSNIQFYIHNSYKKNIGKIISLIKFNSNTIDEKIKSLSKNLCMHIAAMKPESLDLDDLDENIIKNEKNIQRELILNSGKPSNIVEKILEGKMNKFYSDITLYNQSYILDQDKNVKSIISEYSKEYDFKITLFKLISL